MPASIDVLSTLGQGVSGLRIGMLEKGFEEAEQDVAGLVDSAVGVLSAVGAKVRRVSIPEHLAIHRAQMALMPEGANAVFDTGFFGAFTRTYYPASLIATVNRFWAHQLDLLAPRFKIGLIAAEFSRRTYYGRVYAKAQNSRPHFIKAYDKVLEEADILVMPTCLTTAPKYEAPATAEASVKHNLALDETVRTRARNTLPFDFTGHPALAVPVGKAGGLPVSMQLVGRFFDDGLLLRAAYAFEHSVDWDQIIAIGTCHGTLVPPSAPGA